MASYRPQATNVTRFQSTPARSGRQTGRRRPDHGKHGFNPRPREAGDFTADWDFEGRAKVSIHARAKRATRNRVPYQMPRYGFQSTPARSGRRNWQKWHEAVLAVSIHARAKRATPVPVMVGRAVIVSIHARAKRATERSRRPTLALHGFNPRPREAGDSAATDWRSPASSFNPRPREAGDSPEGRPAEPAGELVSIHARAKRATASAGKTSRHSRQFQSTPARSGRPPSPFSSP